MYHRKGFLVYCGVRRCLTFQPVPCFLVLFTCLPSTYDLPVIKSSRSASRMSKCSAIWLTKSPRRSLKRSFWKRKMHIPVEALPTRKDDSKDDSKDAPAPPPGPSPPGAPSSAQEEQEDSSSTTKQQVCTSPYL